MLIQAYEPWFEQNHGPEPTQIWLEELQYMTNDQMLRAWEDCKTKFLGKAPTVFEFKALIKSPDWKHKSAAYLYKEDPNSQAYKPKMIQSDEHVSKNKRKGNKIFDDLKAMMRNEE